MAAMRLATLLQEDPIVDRSPRLAISWTGISPTRASILPANSPRAAPRQLAAEYNNFVATHSVGPQDTANVTNARHMLEYMRGKDGVHRQMTQLSLSNSLVEKEAFDNVYSDRHAHMDTAGHLHSSTLVPMFDPRTRCTNPPDLKYGAEHFVNTALGMRKVLPSRSFMLLGHSAGRSGRHIDF
jgi:hypothetical protein